jgi:hypothetical protein
MGIYEVIPVVRDGDETTVMRETASWDVQDGRDLGEMVLSAQRSSPLAA